MSAFMASPDPIRFGMVLLAACLAGTTASAKQPLKPIAAANSVTQWIDSPLESVQLLPQLNESEDDAIEARALYMQAQMLLQRRQLREALSNLERAWRFDPLLVSIIKEIVPLAVAIQHKDEATRYAVLAAEQQDVPEPLLQSVISILTQQLQFERALRLGERVLHHNKSARPNLTSVIMQYEIGRLAFLTGQFKKSADAFTVVQNAMTGKGPVELSKTEQKQLLPKPELGFALMGEAFLLDNRFDDAEAMFRAADQAKPNPGRLGFRMARIAWAQGNREKAQTLLDSYLNANLSTDGIQPYLLLATLYDPDSKPPSRTKTGPKSKEPTKPTARLLDKLKRLALADPDNEPLGFFYAQQLQQAGKLKDAESQFKKFLKHHSIADAYAGLVDIYLTERQLEPLLQRMAEVVVESGSLDAIQQASDKIIADPKLLGQLSKKTTAWLADREHEAPEGIAMAMTLLEMKAGNQKATEAFFRTAMRRPDPGRGRFAVTVALNGLARRQPKLAILALQQVIDQNLMSDNPAELYHLLAGALAMDHQFDKALQAAQQAVKLAPNSPRMAARVAWVHYYAKQLDVAERLFLDLLTRFDHESDRAEETRDVLRDARQILSAICVQQDRVDAAEEWLLQVLDEFPEDIGAMNDLGYLWADQRQHLQRALAMIRLAVESEQDNIAYRDSLGWVLHRLGRHKQALTELELAAKSEPVDGEILNHLADVYLETNQPKKAIACWKKAVAKFREDRNSKMLKQTEAKLKKYAPIGE